MLKKVLSIFLIGMLLTANCFAAQDQVYSISDFSKMQESHINPYIIPGNAAAEARNVRANTQYGALSKRASTMLYGTFGLFQVTSIHRLYTTDGSDYLIGSGSSYLMLGDDDGGASVILRDQLTSGLRWTWVTYQDNAIGCNGTDNCQKYDGHSLTTANTDGARTASILTADLGAPYAELNTGSNLDVSSWYQYKIQCTDGTTTWYSNAVSNPILTGSSVQDVTLTDIPLCPAGTTSRTIYRTQGQSSRAALVSASYATVATISDNATLTYNDAVADGSLGAAWSISGKVSITPPVVKYITLHRERLFGANAPGLNSYIYWSLPFKPQVFDINDYDFVRIDDGDEITFIKEIAGRLAVGKTNSITNFETQSANDTQWRFYTFSFVGCPAPYSAQNSPLGIIYLGWEGLYTYNGENSQLISDSVSDVMRDILKSNLNNVAGIYYNNEYLLAYTSEESGASDNNAVLVLDTIRNAYVIDDEEVNCWTVFSSGNDFGTLYSGSSDNDGNILSHNPALSTFLIRFKSDLDEGTHDSVTIDGTENSPEMSLGWGIYINNSSMASVTLDSAVYSAATINRPSTSGKWWSPAIRVNASDYDKLYWNEELGCCGNVTFAIRSATTDSLVTVDALAWSSEAGDPAGSDISGATASTYLQLRGTLSTTDITTTPVVDSLNNYVIKLVYSKVGAANETAINSIWKSGFSDLGNVELNPKKINGIDIYYTGTSGTVTISLKNERGDIDQSFSFSLAVDPDSSSTDQYFGTADEKIYKWLPPVNSVTNPTPIGRKWQFKVSEGGATVWGVNRINIKYNIEEEYED